MEQLFCTILLKKYKTYGRFGGTESNTMKGFFPKGNKTWMEQRC